MFTAIWREPFNTGAQERSNPSSQHWEGDSINILLETGCYPSKKKKKKKLKITLNSKYPGQLGGAGAWEGTLSDDSIVIMAVLSVVTGVKCVHQRHS